MNKVLFVSEDAHGGRRLCAAWPNASDMHWAPDMAGAFSQLLTGSVQVVVVDDTACGGKGAALLEEIAHAYPDPVRVYMTSQLDLDSAVHLINKVGVYRLLAKPTTADDFVLAVNAALAVVTSRRVSSQVRRAAELQNTQPPFAPARTFVHGPVQAETVEWPGYSYDSAKLSRREEEILLAVVQGKKPMEIARSFFISVHTARNHIKSLYRKFDVHSQVELIARVLHTPGIVELSSGGRRAG